MKNKGVPNPFTYKYFHLLSSAPIGMKANECANNTMTNCFFYIYQKKEVPMNMTKNIRQLISKIESKTTWDNMVNWSDRKYNELSDKIFEDSSVRISPATLKRISGKFETSNDYIPSESTLDAICQFLGHKDWHSFCKPKKHKKALKKIILVFVPVALLFVFILLIISKKQIRSEDYLIDIKNNTGTAPYTAIFNYQIPDKKGINTVLEFGGYSTQPEPHLMPKQELDPQYNTATYLYTYPDYFHARLKVNEKEIKNIPVHILTKGWQALYLSNKKTYRIVLDHSPIMNGSLNIPRNKIDSLLLKKEHEQSWLQYTYSDTFSFSCENTIISTRIRNREMKEFETGCRFGEITLVGENGSMTFRICDQGCSQWIKIVAGQKRIWGTKEDFSMFECDLTQWQELRMTNTNLKIDFFLQNSLIYSLQYDENIGKLKVIFFDFTVSGEVDFIKITNLKGETLFHDEF